VADVRDRAALQDAVDQGVAEFGRMDIVVANAGVIMFHETSLDITEDLYDLVVDACLKGAWNTIQVTAPVMISAKHGGSVILTNSSSGLRGGPDHAHYVAAKTGIVGLARVRERARRVPHPGEQHPPNASRQPRHGPGHRRRRVRREEPVLPLQALKVLPDLDTDPDSAFRAGPAAARSRDLQHCRVPRLWRRPLQHRRSAAGGRREHQQALTVRRIGVPVSDVIAPPALPSRLLLEFVSVKNVVIDLA
jgi:hypothetical protein